MYCVEYRYLGKTAVLRVPAHSEQEAVAYAFEYLQSELNDTNIEVVSVYTCPHF